MQYQRKYPITQIPGEHILLSWERGYKNVTAHYREREIAFVDNAIKIKKGITFEDAELGSLRLSFSERPMMVNVVVDGYHSPINNSHPAKSLKQLSKFFYLMSVLVFLSLFVTIYNSQKANVVLWTTVILDVIVMAIYTTAAIFLSSGKGWAYFLGTFTFIGFSLLYIFLVFFSPTGLSLITGISIVIRIAIITALLFYAKTALSAIKHAKFSAFRNHDLLDDIKK